MANTATVASVDEDSITVEFGGDLADAIFHQLLRQQARVILRSMEQTITDIYENGNSFAMWEDLQHDMKRIEAINVLLEYHGRDLIDIVAEMEKGVK